MTQKNSTIKKITIISIIIMMFFLQNLISVFSIFNFTKNNSVFAESFSEISIANSNFTSSSDSKPGEPTSYSAVGTKASTIAGVIDTDVEVFEKEHEENYKLNYNPSKPSLSSDNKILMINNQNINTNESFGYASTNFTLNKNGYYMISCYVYTQDDANISSTASLYLSNEKLDKLDTNKLENISTDGAWEEFRFYVKTASSDESVQLVMYIGTKDNFKSAGAVFFDNLKAYSLSESEYQTQLSNINKTYKEIALKTKDVSVANGILNGDFETSTLDFNKVPSNTGVGTTGNIAKVIGIGDYFNSEDSNLEVNPTSANRNNNKYALLINNTVADFVAFESNDIKIEQHKNYKLSIDVKTSSFSSNGANITLTQINPFTSEDYVVSTKTISSINTSSQTNAVKNDWITYSFYIKGNVFKDSVAKLTLALGDKDNLINGYALFDNITLEEITTSDYTNDSTSTNAHAVDFSNISETPSIANGAFNYATINSTDDAYPYEASNIKVENKNEDNFNGIINVNSKNFNSKNYPFINPVSVNNSNADLSYNNVFVLANTTRGYQTAKTENITLSASSYYKVSAYVNTQSIVDNGVNISLKTNNSTLGFVRNINTNGQWQEISFVIKTYESEQTANLVLSLGSELNLAKGYAFFDNLTLEKIEEADYNNIVVNSNTYKTDLSKIDLNITSENSNNYIYEALNFTSTKNSNLGIVEAGIMNVSTNPSLDVGYTNDPNVLVIHNITDSYYSMKSSDFTLTNGNYYKVSVDIKTLYIDQEETNIQKDEEGNIIAHGAKIELTGLNESFDAIITGSDYETYTFYISATSASTISLNLSLGNENALTRGYAFFDNMSFETIDEQAFNTAKNAEENDKVIIIGDTTQTPEEDVKPNASSANFDWLIVPTLIVSVALLIAMIGLLIRKLNIKLPTRTHQVKEYDRAKTIIKEHERREHLKQREAKLQALREKLLQIQNELDATKNEYKSIKSFREEVKVENRKIEEKIKADFKDVTSKQAVDESRKLKLEAKQKIKETRKANYIARRNELINKYLEIEKEIEMILEEERLLVQEYKAYKKQLKLQKQEAKAKKKSKK